MRTAKGSAEDVMKKLMKMGQRDIFEISADPLRDHGKPETSPRPSQDGSNSPTPAPRAARATQSRVA